jgi:murein tripeptide amidase MpaA
MTVEYLTYNIINGYKAGDAEYLSILDTYDFYIMPAVNPDGFVFSQRVDRLWRKNRKPNRGALGLPTCTGTDVSKMESLSNDHC